MTKILIKRLSKKVILPKYETVGSSGMDLAACINETIIIQFDNTVFIFCIDFGPVQFPAFIREIL